MSFGLTFAPEVVTVRGVVEDGVTKTISLLAVRRRETESKRGRQIEYPHHIDVRTLNARSLREAKSSLSTLGPVSGRAGEDHTVSKNELTVQYWPSGFLCTCHVPPTQAKQKRESLYENTAL